MKMLHLPVHMDPVPQGTPVAPQPAPPVPGKFNASRMIVAQSWALLKQDKEILWFPVLSAIASLMVLVMVALLYFFFVLKGDAHIFSVAFSGNEALMKSYFENLGDNATMISYGVLFIYYLL